MIHQGLVLTKEEKMKQICKISNSVQQKSKDNTFNLLLQLSL